MTTVERERRGVGLNGAPAPQDHSAEADKVEALVAASETAAWARLEVLLPYSYRSSYTRRAHRAGFNAGLQFARLALMPPTEATDSAAATS